MFEPYPDDLTPLATPRDAMREWAENVGYLPQHRGYAWLLHDWDVWIANPHYRGPAQPHPDSEEEPVEDYIDGRPLSFWESFPYIRVKNWEQYNGVG